MKLISLLLTLCLTFNVLASSGTIQELERHIDDYQYAMTVEWDQKDQAFYDSQTNLFLEKVGHLISEQGLTKKEISNLLEKKMINRKALEAIELKFRLMGEKQSAAEMLKVLKDHSGEFYSQGASWNGSVDPSTIGAAILIIALLFISTQYECVEYGDKWVCDGTTYSDGSYHETCGWEKKCVRYEKK